MEEINQAVAAEFSSEKYLVAAEHINTKWPDLSAILIELQEIPSFKLLDKYKIILTRYGSGGSYNSVAGEVILNIERRPPDQLMGTIAHEIVHIGIQDFINKYEIKHWFKERLVDLIGQRYFPNLRKMQKIEPDVSALDAAFGKFFPDLDAILDTIKSEGL